MKKTFHYTNSNVRWLMSIDGQNVQVFCDGESRTYTIPEKINRVEQNDEYVFIYVEGGNYYQFKFEVDKFLVGDIYDENDEFVDSFASFVFGED